MTGPATQSRLFHLRRRHSAFYAATLLGLATLAAAFYPLPTLAPELAALVFVGVYLGLMAHRLPRLTAQRLKTSPERDDNPATVILLVTLMAVLVSIAALFNALNRAHDPSVFEVGLAFASVIGGWLTIHTMFAMHYAHRFWLHRRGADGLEPSRGLSFPETEEPGGYEFLYFSFVIGMTAQTSDVAITTTAMRRLNLGHAIVSFFFNTVLVAAAVNAVVSLAG